MIGPLRTRHRVMWSLLAIALPLLYVAGLNARNPPAVQPELPALSPVRIPPGAERMVQGRNIPLGGARYTITSYRAKGETDAYLECVPQPGPAQPVPDGLVYWFPRLEEDRVPEGSLLLGSFPSGKTAVFNIPARMGPEGYLYLYSLAHEQLVDTAGPIPIMDPGGDDR